MTANEIEENEIEKNWGVAIAILVLLFLGNIYFGFIIFTGGTTFGIGEINEVAQGILLFFNSYFILRLWRSWEKKFFSYFLYSILLLSGLMYGFPSYKDPTYGYLSTYMLIAFLFFQAGLLRISLLSKWRMLK